MPSKVFLPAFSYPPVIYRSVRYVPSGHLRQHVPPVLRYRVRTGGAILQTPEPFLADVATYAFYIGFVLGRTLLNLSGRSCLSGLELGPITRRNWVGFGHV